MPQSSASTRESSSSPMKRNTRQRRKPTIWTREKIYKLIDLYRASDCLWNHYSELYKNKDCRTKAIEHICASLGITKNDYGKKVHNLRNQFNSELKKYERRLEETGENTALSAKTCRWEHFETLMFLRPIIEPRPGYLPQCKKLQKNHESINSSDCSTENNNSTSKKQLDDFVDLHLLTVTDTSNTSCIKDLSTCEAQTAPKAELVLNRSTTPTPSIENRSTNFTTQPNMRDQWDAFGELIANEFRNLNSAVSRKKLKRKIMQVMLEVGEEDDQNYASAN